MLKHCGKHPDSTEEYRVGDWTTADNLRRYLEDMSYYMLLREI